MSYPALCACLFGLEDTEILVVIYLKMCYWTTVFEPFKGKY